MCLVIIAVAVTLSGDTKADTLVLPFVKGEIATPGTYCKTLPQIPECTLMLSQPGYILLKHIGKYKLQ